MKKPRKPATLAVTGGRDPRRFLGAINTPVFHASTIAFRDVAELERAERGEREASLGPAYGLHGLPTVTDLQAVLAELEGGAAAYAKYVTYPIRLTTRNERAKVLTVATRPRQKSRNAMARYSPT